MLVDNCPLVADRQTNSARFWIIGYRGTHTFLFTINKTSGIINNQSQNMVVAQTGMNTGGVATYYHHRGKR